MKSFRDNGLVYIERGYAIIPIPPGTKGPRNKGWEQNYATTPEQYAKLLKSAHANSGIGVIAKFNPAIDIDSLDAEMSDHMITWVRENIADAPLRFGKRPKALFMFIADTPFRKITSALFRSPNGPRKGERVEILGNGQQFVADHIHPDTGKPYEWDWDSPLTVDSLDLPILTKDDAERVCHEFERKAEELGWERIGDGTISNEDDPDSADDFDAIAEIPPPEETKDEIERVQSALEAMTPGSSDYSYDEWRNILFALKWTRWECAEDLARAWSETSEKHDAKEFRTVWRGAQKKSRGKEVTLATLYKMAKDAGWDSSRSSTPTEEEAEEIVERLLEAVDDMRLLEDKPTRAIKKIINELATSKLDATDETSVLKAIKRLNGDSIGDLRVALKAAKEKAKKEDAEVEAPTHANYAKALLTKIEERSGGEEAVSVEGMLFSYSKLRGVWQGTLPNDASVDVARYFDGLENCMRRSDYMAIANHAYTVAMEGNEDFFNDAPVGLACEGRFYFVNKEGKIEREKIGPQHRQRVLAPVRPEVGEMPLFQTFLDQTFDGEGKDEQVGLVQEIIGATVLGVMGTFEKAVLFKGLGRSGKSTLMKIIEATLHKDTQTAVSPFNWNDEYYIANLAGKRLNAVGELPDDEPIPASSFKSVIGRDRLTARHPTMRPFTFHNSATHIFNSNHFINTRDHSEAFYSRWLIVEFRNSLIGKDTEIDRNLAQRIIDAELPQILAWALQGAKRLQERNYFEVNKVHDKLMGQWRRRTNTLIEFLLDQDVCRLKPDESAYRVDFYRAYVDWCRQTNRRPFGKIKLYDEFNSPHMAGMQVFFGTDASGRDLIRGVVLRGEEDWAYNLDDEL